MASDAIAPEAQPTSARAGAALQHNPWRSFRGLSSVARVCEHFLAGAGLDRGPWLAVAFAGGIAAWFGLGNRWHWQGFILLGLAIAAGAAATGLRHQPGDGASVAGDQDGLATLDIVEQAGEMGLGVGRLDLAHGSLNIDWSVRLVDLKRRPGPSCPLPPAPRPCFTPRSPAGCKASARLCPFVRPIPGPRAETATGSTHAAL